MKKTAVLVDSTAYMDNTLKNNKNLRIVYLTVNIDKQVKKEILDINMDEYLKYLSKERKKFPTTSQPAIGEIVKVLQNLKKEGYTDVIAIALSSGISGTYSSYKTASLMVEGIELHTFDSEVSCQAETYYVRKALRLIEEGVCPEKIINELDEMKKISRAYFVVDDLSHLQRGGRLTHAEAIIGSLLQVKPILHFENTKIVPYQKIRTLKKTIKKMYELFDEYYTKNIGKNIYISVLHINNIEKAEEIKEYLESNYKNINIEVGEIGPVIATHLGPGVIGMCYTIL